MSEQVKRVAVEVDTRRIPGIRHEHPKRKGFWAGRTKVAPGTLRFWDRGGRHRAPLSRLNRDGWLVVDAVKGAWRVEKRRS
jgi:hypothetical protein